MFLSRRGLGATSVWFCALGLMLAGAGCEPASITDAHTQVARGPLRTVSLVVPIIDTTEVPAQFVGPDTVTTPQGLLGIKFDPESVAVGVGNQLRFNSVVTTRFKHDITPSAILGIPGTYTQTGNYTLLSVEPRLTAVDSVLVSSGNISITTYNQLPVPLTFTVTLNGFHDAGGATLSQTSTIPQAPGVNGSYTSATVSFDLAGVTIAPPTANADLSLTFTVPGGGIAPATLADSAIIQSGGGTIVVGSLWGPLDPAQTFELTVSVGDSQQIDSTMFDFGDLTDGLDSVTFNDAQVTLTLTNTSGAPIVLSNFVLKCDSAGTAITIPVADPGVSTLTLARSQTGKVITLQAARLLNSVVHQALKGGRPAIVATGTATVGDGAASWIADTSEVSVGLGLTVGADFTIPASGMSFTRTAVTSGLDLGTKNADQLAQLVDTVVAAARVTNHTPFGVEVRVALVDDTLLLVNDTLCSTVTADSIFKRSDRVELAPVSVLAAPVDALGRVTVAAQSADSVGLSGTQSQVLLGKKIIAGIKVTLVPSSSSGRGALSPTDQVDIHASGSVKLHSGGAP